MIDKPNIRYVTPPPPKKNRNKTERKDTGNNPVEILMIKVCVLLLNYYDILMLILFQ